ncbi:MAG: protein phosphatase 2C domain-containing protein [Vicinamibacterales bacterium]
MRISGVTHQGNVRSSNEDAMVWDEALGFAAVADGMGGHQAGEVASALALEALHNFLRRSDDGTDFTWPFGVSPSLSLAANRLATGFRLANRRVFRKSEESADYVGMGTTLVAALFGERKLTVASVGDSRVYLIAEGGIRQLTEDDSWFTVLSREPGVTLESLAQHPLRNVLTNVIGARAELEVATYEVTTPVEAVLLSSDGLHNVLTPEVMYEIAVGLDEPQEASQRLIRAALGYEASDNMTVVILRP